jgi:hypothetical protein
VKKSGKIDIDDIIALIGAGLIGWGLYEIFMPAAIIFAGIILILIGIARTRMSGE